MRGAVHRIPARLTSLGSLLAALLWAQGLGQATVAGDSAPPDSVPALADPITAASTDRGISGHLDPFARLGKSWRLRSPRHRRVVPRIVFGDDPNDNETSDDPNDDDDAWDDYNAHEDTDVPIFGGLWEAVAYLNTSEPLLVSPAVPPLPPFLTHQRLRC
jgi:hypothetical protein